MEILTNINKNKTAFITGIAGQDGSYLTEHLLELGYKVYGIIRRNSVPEHQESRISHLSNEIETMYGDVNDISSLTHYLKLIKPDEIYNLAAQSHVRISFDIPQFTAQVNAIGVLNMLEAFKNESPKSKFYQASSSEMFGNSVDSDGKQRETTPMHPTSVYGCSKLFGYSLVRHYRNAYKLFASNGILFNHESPRRGTNFVTNKIVKSAVRIKLGIQHELVLGNMDSFRDWGHSYDYVRAMRLILNYKQPDDFVISTGVSHSVREVVEYVFGKLKLDVNKYVKQDKKYMRAEELKYLCGDSSKARKELGWFPTYTFESLLDEIISYWINFYSIGATSK